MKSTYIDKLNFQIPGGCGITLSYFKTKPRYALLALNRIYGYEKVFDPYCRATAYSFLRRT